MHTHTLPKHRSILPISPFCLPKQTYLLPQPTPPYPLVIRSRHYAALSRPPEIPRRIVNMTCVHCLRSRACTYSSIHPRSSFPSFFVCFFVCVTSRGITAAVEQRYNFLRIDTYSFLTCVTTCYKNIHSFLLSAPTLPLMLSTNLRCRRAQHLIANVLPNCPSLALIYILFSIITPSTSHPLPTPLCL